MANVFELSASLTMDVSRFEAEVRRAEALASGLQGSLDRLNRSIDATLGRLRTLEGGLGGAGLPGTRVAAQGREQGMDMQMLALALGRALAGVTVRLDGREVGRLVAPEVDRAIGREALIRRVTG